MVSKIFTPITSAAAANGAGNETNVGSARFVLVQNSSASGSEVLVTLRTSADVTIGTFYVPGDSSLIIKKATTDTVFAADGNVYFTAVTVTTI